MKKEYPSYVNTTLEAVFKKQTKKNKELITEFLEYCKITASDNSIKKISGKIIQIADIVQKDLDNLELEDLRKFLAVLNSSDRSIATKNDTKKIFKRFIKWKYEDWSKKFKELKDAKVNSNGEGRKLSKEDLLTPDEMQILIKSVDSLKYKTLLLVLQETASRPEEILKTKWKDYNFQTNELKLHSSKTGGIRTIPLNESQQHLKRYREECFISPRGEDYIFPAPRDKEKSLSVQALNDFLNKLEKRLKFHKHLYPYLWRHSILSKRIRELSPKVYEMYAGHCLETGMKTYSHLDNQDLREELFSNSYKIEELTPKEKSKLKEMEKEIENLRTTILNERKESLMWNMKVAESLEQMKPEILREAIKEAKQKWKQAT